MTAVKQHFNQLTLVVAQFSPNQESWLGLIQNLLVNTKNCVNPIFICLYFQVVFKTLKSMVSKLLKMFSADLT